MGWYHMGKCSYLSVRLFPILVPFQQFPWSYFSSLVHTDLTTAGSVVY